MSLGNLDSRAQVFHELQHLLFDVRCPLLVFALLATGLRGQGLCPLPPGLGVFALPLSKSETGSPSSMVPSTAWKLAFSWTFTQEENEMPQACKPCCLNSQRFSCNQNNHWNCDQCSLKLGFRKTKPRGESILVTNRKCHSFFVPGAFHMLRTGLREQGGTDCKYHHMPLCFTD